MWPQALQMTRDECRGILRRLELESYSQVISVFRAQGGLSDAKAKLLEDLRCIFHISNERHRAEARRVANDEQLATIAEAISGPNTWQEWAREGRRPYPMLPRVAPQTALAILANNVAEETAQENSKLPYPAETAEAVKEEQQQLDYQKSSESVVERNNYVVTSDPFKIPEIPQNPKKNLKRNSEIQGSGTGKKRSLGDGPAQHTQIARKNYPHITANSPQINSSTSSMDASSERKQKLNAVDQHLEKQRFFHRQHQITKQKMAKKAAAAAASANNAAVSGGGQLKRQATPAKSGRRANQKLQQEQKQIAVKQMQGDMQQQQQIPLQIDLTGEGGIRTTTGGSSAQAILTQQQIDMQFVTYATHHQPPQQIFKEKDIDLAQSQLSGMSTGAPAIVVPVSSSNQHAPSLLSPLSSPQIAASKRDISKNLNKLQMQQNQQLSSSASNVSSAFSAPAVPFHDHTSLGNVLSSSDKNKSTEKTLISTTPVQKYIVEERQPGMSINLPTCSNPSTLVNLQNPHGSTSTPTHIIQVSNAGQQPQIMSFPQISAAATKLRAVNTTLIAPGNKITSTPTKKIISGALSSASTTVTGSGGSSVMNAGALHELANVASTQSQVLHIVESVGNSNSSNATHGTPLHTPPAVIQIHSTGGSSTTSSSDISMGSNQSKVLTTKILPLVLAGAGNQNTANSALLNNSTLVMSSSPANSVSITSTTSTAGGSAIIKSLTSNMVLNTSTANLSPVTVTGTNNAIISSLGSGATVFRKPPHIIKSSVAATTPSKPTSPSSAPQIISNVKLTPVSVGPTSSGTHLTTPNSFKNVLPSTSGMVRTSVKICQSPNGKVFIQPAGLVDGTKMKLTTSSMPHKIISNTPTVNSSAITSSGHRIAIQKVQIIPAPIGSPAGGNALQAAGNHINTKSGKSNMIFMPASTTNVRPVTLSKMGNNILLKSSANQQMTQTSPITTVATTAGDNSMAKTNIVVLGPSSTTLVKEQISSQNVKHENTQLINEDTPLDILNMPIVMEPGVNVTSSSSTAESVTVLQSNIIDASDVSSPSGMAPPIILDQTQLQQPPKTVMLNVDWEMKLDIEQQNQYNSKNLKQSKRALSTSSATTSSSSNLHITSGTSSHGIKQKRLNNDYMSMKLKEKDSSNSKDVATITTTNPANNMIVVDDSFDDVIVEEHEDETSSSMTTLEKHQQQQKQQRNDDIPKILDMQIYQQHDGHSNRIAQIKSTGNDDDVNVDTNDDEDSSNNKLQSRQLLQSQETTRSDIKTVLQQLHRKEHPQQHQQQQFSHVESEIDAGFDETIVTEIDENTASEYIEEDVTTTNASKKTNATGTILVTRNNMQKNAPNSALATTMILNQEDPKTGNISNNYLISSKPGEKVSIAKTASESLAIGPTTTTYNVTQKTTANNSSTQKLEP